MSADSDMRLIGHRPEPSDASVELRECVDFSRGGLDVSTKAVSARGVGPEVVVQSTCNRASWLQSCEIIPTLVALRQRFEAIRLAELTRLEPKLSALSPEARTRLDELTRLIVERLLFTPTEQVTSVSDGPMKVRYADALNRLFRLATEDNVEPLSEDSETTVSGTTISRKRASGDGRFKCFSSS
jgi:glutamyl-tRNA reductase